MKIFNQIVKDEDQQRIQRKVWLDDRSGYLAYTFSTGDDYQELDLVFHDGTHTASFFEHEAGKAKEMVELIVFELNELLTLDFRPLDPTD